MGVQAALMPEQFLVGSDLDDLAAAHADDSAAGADRRQAMRK